MLVTLLAIGSRGDVQPYVALGDGLRASGHDVRVATHAPFRELVESRGLAFAPLPGDPRAIIQGDETQAWIDSGRDVVAFARRLVPLMRELLDSSLGDIERACEGADAIVYSSLAFPADHVAERDHVPALGAALQPIGRTRAFPTVMGSVGRRLPGVLNLLTHVAVEQALWQPYRRPVNAWRQGHLGLAPLPFLGPYRRMREERHPLLLGYSSAVLEKPVDWPPWFHVTGYWFLPRPGDWRPDPALEAFLAAGPEPVYIGFGSMRPRDPRRLGEVVAAGLERSGTRAVVHRGWADLHVAAREDVHVVEEVPHDWLFPRMAAVVHHGGAGTTGSAIRAGVPAVVCPFFADQFFWAARVRDLGVGPAAPPTRDLTPESLAHAIRVATGDPRIRERAEALGRRVAGEDGVGRAVEAIEAHAAPR